MTRRSITLSLIWSTLIFQFVNICSAQTIFERNQTPNDPIEYFASSSNFHGATWADVNNDHYPDLFIPPGSLFLNNGDGSFSKDLTTQIGFDAGLGFSSSLVQTSGHRAGASWGDIDNDGDLDCFLVKSTILPKETLIDALYLNDGFGNFTRDTSALWNNTETSWGCSMADFDANGFLDIVSAHPAGYMRLPRPSSFFINTDGHPANFVKDTTYGFTQGKAPYTIPYWSDYDMDGDQDLFIASGPGGSPGLDSIYKNLMVEKGSPGLKAMDSEFTKALQDGQCYNFIDYDNDGDKDVFIVNWTGAANQFYRNDNGAYTLIEMPFSYNKSGLTNSWADVDNDGDQDVLVTNFASSRSELYLNDKGKFTLSKELYNQFGNVGAVFADVENDGRMDLFLNGPNNSAFYRNVLKNDNHFIHLELEGVASNRAAIGANVVLYTSINEQPRVQIREVSAQNSFQGHSDLRLHFGLGTATTIDSMTIMWPSLKEDRYYNIHTIDRVLKIVEGKRSITSVDLKKRKDLFYRQFKISAASENEKLVVTDKNPSFDKKLHLFNSQGSPIDVLDWKKTINQVEIPWEDKPTGIYWIQITGKNQSKASFRYVKE